LHEGILDILRYLSENGLPTTIISNGTCFSPANIALLTAYQPGIQLTFDGSCAEQHDVTRGKGNFSTLIRGYRAAREAGYHGQVAIRVNLYQSNLDDFDATLAMIDREFLCGRSDGEISSVTPAFLHKSSAGDDRFREYISVSDYGKQRQIHEAISKWNESGRMPIIDVTDAPDIGCPFNGDNSNIHCGIRIAINGDVFPCQLFSGESYRIGNIYRGTLEEIVNSPRMNAFLGAIHARRDANAKCTKCAFRGLCGGGCPGLALIEYGTIDEITNRCDERKAHIYKGVRSNLSNHRNENSKRETEEQSERR